MDGYWYWTDANGTAADACRRCLEAAGLRLVPWAPGATGPGLLLYSSLSDDTMGMVRRASHNGRVLAIRQAASGRGDDDPWSLLDCGADDVVTWGGDDVSTRSVIARLERWRLVDDLLDSPVVRTNLIGNSPQWRAIVRQLVETARCTDNAVLITGETGTGKELAAKLIHALDRRRDKTDLIVVDCTTIVPTLSGSEFFGHEKGSFTGAVAARDGAFGLADGGTLFLDEIGELPLGLQAELLRVIQEGTYKRVGGNTWRRTAFRLVCATNRDLQQRVRDGRFRSDLYFRIAASDFTLPPLRERVDDIVTLAEHFVSQSLPAHEPPHFDSAVRSHLQAREYPGNVRELRQLVGRLVARHAGPGPISVGDVPPAERTTAPADGLEASLSTAVRVAVRNRATLRTVKDTVRDEMLAQTIAAESDRDSHGFLPRAAKRLDVSVRTLQLWLKAQTDQANAG